MPTSHPRLLSRTLRRWLLTSVILGGSLAIAYSLFGRRPGKLEITFKHATPQLSPVASPPSIPSVWLAKVSEMLGKLNPKPPEITRPPQMTPELAKSVEFWYQKLLLRYPELAVPMRTVPDAQNGCLQLLNLTDRLKGKDQIPPFPAAITDYLQQKGPWQLEIAQKWLEDNQTLVAEIHDIDLLADRSVNGIPTERLCSIPARELRMFNEILMLEARLAADRGEAAAALEAIRAAYGILDHLSKIETPILFMAIVKILNQLSLENYVLTEIFPTLPADQLNLTAWEGVVNSTPDDPADYARIFKGEWNVGVRSFLLPLLLTQNPSEPITDGGALLDFYALHCAENYRTFESATMRDLATLTTPKLRDVSHLSATSRKFVETMTTGSDSWLRGWLSPQSKTAMTRAAFAIMKGQPIPQDPIYGLDYGWDPATRQLSFPTGAPGKHDIPPITVPKIGPGAAP